MHTEYQVNHKTQSFWIKVVHLVPNVQTLAGHAVGTIRLAATTTLRDVNKEGAAGQYAALLLAPQF